MSSSSRSLKPGISLEGTSSSEPSRTSQAMTGASLQKLGPRTARRRETRSSSGSRRGAAAVAAGSVRLM
jgi:hypothetical protein